MQHRPPVLIHYHIYKNAGTSIERLLRDSFGDRWTTFDGESPHDIIKSAKLKAFLDAHPNIRAVSSHLARPPLPFSSARPILMLRHPVDRARSVYHYARLDKTQPDHRIARKVAFPEYVEWFLNQTESGVVIRNYQVVHLSEASFRYKNVQMARAETTDLEHAKAILAEWRVFGLVRRFADSCRLFSAHYGQEFSELRLREINQNVSTSATVNEEDAIAQAHAELGDVTFGRLVEANRLDLGLYEVAQQRFAERIAALAI